MLNVPLVLTSCLENEDVINVDTSASISDIQSRLPEGGYQYDSEVDLLALEAAIKPSKES